MTSRKIVTALVVLFLGIGTIWAKDFRTVVFKVEQMMCENCEKKVKDNIKFEKGLKKLTTDLKNKTATIIYDAEKTDVETLKAGFRKFKYEAVVIEEKKEE